jgi:hypothetical protein
MSGRFPSDYAPGGTELHFLQNTFRNRVSREFGKRVNFSAYVLVLKDGKVRREELYGSLSTLTMDNPPQKLLGFVANSDSGFPDIFMYSGPFDFGPWIQPVYYLWIDKKEDWEEYSSYEATLRPAGTVAFDPESAELRYGFNEESAGSVENIKGSIEMTRLYLEERSEQEAEERTPKP